MTSGNKESPNLSAEEIQRLSARGYFLALRIIGRTHWAEEAVQNAWVRMMKKPRGEEAVAVELRLMRLVKDCALNLMAAERARKRGESVGAMETSAAKNFAETEPEKIAAQREIGAAARTALNRLPLDLRLAVSLCCEQGYTQTMAGEILNVPQQTIAWRVEKGLAQLRRDLEAAGFASVTPPILATALNALELPALPAGLATFGGQAKQLWAASKSGGITMSSKILIGAILLSAGATTGVFLRQGSGGGDAPTTAAAKGDQEWPNAEAAPSTEGKPAPSNPYVGMRDREEIYEFAEKPKVVNEGGKRLITFATTANCDVTITILNKDGVVIRHLAAGVLGPNAPWPFQQNSLSQKIEWDGNDNFGKTAPPGCAVKVGLGVGFSYERAMGWSADSMAAQSIVVGNDGTVYCVGSRSIRVFDRDGKYLRTLLPPQGGLKTEEYAAFPLIKTRYGDHVLYSDWMGPFASLEGVVGGCALTPDDSKLLCYFAGDPYRSAMQLLVINARTGALSAEGVRKIGHVTDSTGGKINAGVGVWGVEPHVQTTEQYPRTRLPIGVHLAVAPDGETVYFSGVKNAVYKKKLSEMTYYGRLNTPVWKVKPEEASGKFPELFVGDRDKAGNDEKLFNRTAGVACDKDGNVYVGDFFNNRIQVFKPDGTFVKSLPAQRPGQIAVNRRTGEVFYADTTAENAALVKLGGLSDPTVKAKFNYAYKFKDRDRDLALSPALGLDAEATPPIVWFGVGAKTIRLLDKGTTFELSAEIVGGGGGGAGGRCIAVDLDTETVYTSDGGIFSPRWSRFDGKTGQRDDSFNRHGWEDLTVAPNGDIYCRTGGYGRFVVRFDRDWKPLPFKHGVPPTVKVNQPYGGEPPANWPADGNAIYVGVVGHSNVWQPGFAVGANGDVYVRTQGVTKPWYERRFIDGKPTPLSPEKVVADWNDVMPAWNQTPHAPDRSQLISVWDRDGIEKTPMAVVKPSRGAGVQTDLHGNLYLSVGSGAGLNAHAGWPELADKTTTYRSWGSQSAIAKFANQGSFPLGSMAKPDQPEGLVWAYAGHAPSCPNDCGCAHSRFCVDLFGRVFVPSMQLYSIMILDANGNRIMRLGRYGNADCQGKHSLVPEPDIGLHWVKGLAVSNTALYISDAGNGRLLKAAISYAVEEIIPAP